LTERKKKSRDCSVIDVTATLILKHSSPQSEKDIILNTDQHTKKQTNNTKYKIEKKEETTKLAKDYPTQLQ
jgi:hypothetical protein